MIATEQEDDGRWIAEDTTLPGCLVYAATEAEAVEKAKQLAAEIRLEREAYEKLGKP